MNNMNITVPTSLGAKYMIYLGNITFRSVAYTKKDMAPRIFAASVFPYPALLRSHVVPSNMFDASKNAPDWVIA
jgi:hypothetical protein